MFPILSISNLLEIASALVVVAGGSYGFVLWVGRTIKRVSEVFEHLDTVVGTVKELSGVVVDLSTKHLPHIQNGLDNTVQAVAEIKTSVQAINCDLKELDRKVVAVSTTQQDMKQGMHSLGEAFINHLDHAASEHITSRVNIEKNSAQIDAILQAERVKQTTLEVAMAIGKKPVTLENK